MRVATWKRSSAAMAIAVLSLCSWANPAAAERSRPDRVVPAGCANTPSWKASPGAIGDPCREPAPLALGGSHSCALMNGGKVICWGNNAKGQLGHGDTVRRGDEPNEMGDNLPRVDLAGTAKAIAAGVTHTCALLVNGSVKCWGNNEDGRLGHGDTVSRGDGPDEMGVNLPTVDLGGEAVAIGAGKSHTCALLADGSVKCWGGNIYGYGNVTHIGDEPGELGTNLQAVDLDGTVVALTAGDNHTCVLLTDGNVKCWGKNSRGQLGYGNTNHRGDNAGEMGVNLPNVQLGLTGGVLVTSITAGENHTCALLSDGTVKCWGKNTRGQLGIGNTTNKGDNGGEMGNNLGAVDLGGVATSISAGENHTCALLTTGLVKCWGDNEFGHLGQGSTAHLGDNANELRTAPAIDLGATARTVVAGDNHTCALLTDGGLKCWGKDEIGHLGYGEIEHRGDEVGEMGDSLLTLDLGKRRF